MEYRRTEGILYSHFRKKKRIERIEYEIEILKQSIYQIKHDLQEVNVELSDTMQGIDYSTDKIQYSNITSAVEKELIRITEKLDRELTMKLNRRAKLKERLRSMREEVKRIEKILAELTEEEMKLIELKYAGQRTLRQIAYILHCDVATIKRRKDKIIEYISSEIA